MLILANFLLTACAIWCWVGWWNSIRKTEVALARVDYLEKKLAQRERQWQEWGTRVIHARKEDEPEKGEYNVIC